MAITLTEEGTYTITVTTTDNVGNIAEKIYTVKIDKTLPIIAVETESVEYAKTRKVVILATDDEGAGLRDNNSYEYYLSTSNSSLTGGEWTNYTSGEEFTIGEGKTGTYYLFVKRVVDNAENISKEAGSIQQIGEEEYQKFGPYKFDNTDPMIKSIEVENNKVKIEVKDEDSGVTKYRYITSGTRITNPRITETNSTEVEATGEIIIEKINEVRYIYVIAEDRVGNRSNIEEVEIPKITIEGQANLETGNGQGGVDLSWNIGTGREKTYKIYQKSETEEEWQEVGETNETRITINTAKDIASPNMPEIELKGIDESNKININQKATDNGSIYKFYVEASDREDNSIVLSTSEEIMIEVKTGIKGYYGVKIDFGHESVEMI